MCGNYTEAALQRVAKSMDISNYLKEKLYPQYIDRYILPRPGTHRGKYFEFYSEDYGVTERLGHRVADWEDQVEKGVEDMMVSNPNLNCCISCFCVVTFTGG